MRAATQVLQFSLGKELTGVAVQQRVPDVLAAAQSEVAPISTCRPMTESGPAAAAAVPAALSSPNKKSIPYRWLHGCQVGRTESYLLYYTLWRAQFIVM